MKRLFLVPFLFLALTLYAQDPLLPLRLDLNDSYAPNSVVYARFLIHDGNEMNILWANSDLDPDSVPSLAVPVKLTGRTLYLLLGDSALENMTVLPKDLFSGGVKRKLRIWLANDEYAPVSLLTPDLDLVAAPFALRSEEFQDLDPIALAEHGSDISYLKASAANADRAIEDLELVCRGLKNGTILVDSPVTRFFQRFSYGEDGSLEYRISPRVEGCVSPGATPEHYGNFATHLGSAFALSQTSTIESITLYFSDPSEIAPPASVAFFLNELQITTILSALAVSTNSFPYCVYTFGGKDTTLPPGKYYVGLRTNTNYAVIHPYVCEPYRGGGLSYYFPPATISATIPPQLTEYPYWKVNDETKELWAQVGFKDDKKISFRPDGGITVSSISIPTGGSWYVGTESERCDIVLANSEACLRAASGDLVLAAAGDIKPASLVDFSPAQGGRADISPGETEVSVYPNGLSQDAVIVATPLQEVSVPYWVEVDAAGGASIHVSAPQDHTLGFTYALIRK